MDFPKNKFASIIVLRNKDDKMQSFFLYLHEMKFLLSASFAYRRERVLQYTKQIMCRNLSVI
jgi:hypothetical protein